MYTVTKFHVHGHLGELHPWLNCFQFYFICLLNYYVYVPVVVSATIKMTKLPTIRWEESSQLNPVKHTLTVPIQYHPITKVVKSTGVVSQIRIRKEVFDSFRRSTTMIDSGKKTKVTTRPSIHTSGSERASDTHTHTDDECDKEVLKVAFPNQTSRNPVFWFRN